MVGSERGSTILTEVGGAQRLLTGPTLPGWISILVRVAGVAAVIPLAFRVLSSADAVLWMFFTTVFALSPALDFGHGSTFMRFIAYARAARGGPGEIGVTHAIRGSADARLGLGQLLKMMPRTYARLTLTSCALSLVVVSLLAIGPIRASTNPFVHTLIWVAVCIALAVQTYCGQFVAVLQGYEKVASQRWIEAGQGLLANLAAGLALWQQEELTGAMLALCASSVGASLAYRAAAQRAVRTSSQVIDLDASSDDDARATIWSAVWRSGIGIVFGLGLPYLLTLSASNFLAPAIAASFMFAMRIAQVISALSQSPFYGYLPSLARQYRQGLLIEVRRSARCRMAGATLVLATGFFCAGVLIPPVMLNLRMTIGFVGPETWLILGFALLAERIGGMHMQLYTLGGRIIWHWVNGATGIAMLLLTIALASRFEVLAIPVAMLAANVLVYCVLVLPRSYMLLSLRFTQFDLYVALPASAVMALYGFWSL